MPQHRSVWWSALLVPLLASSALAQQRRIAGRVTRMQTTEVQAYGLLGPVQLLRVAATDPDTPPGAESPAR